MPVEVVMLGTSDLAPLLGVTQRRVVQIIEEEGIPHTRRGRKIIVPRVCWEDWLRTQAERAVGASKEKDHAAASKA